MCVEIINYKLSLNKEQRKRIIFYSKQVIESGHWGNGDYRVWMKSNEHIDYVMNLIKQSFEKQKK